MRYETYSRIYEFKALNQPRKAQQLNAWTPIGQSGLCVRLNQFSVQLCSMSKHYCLLFPFCFKIKLFFSLKVCEDGVDIITVEASHTSFPHCLENENLIARGWFPDKEKGKEAKGIKGITLKQFYNNNNK